MAKTCSRCKTSKPLPDFPRARNSPDGFGYWCRQCCAERWRERIADPSVVVADRERQRQHIAEKRKDPAWVARKRKILRKHVAANREAVNERQRLYAAGRQAKRLWTARDRARAALKRAVRQGKIVRPTACSACPSTIRIQAHHADYSRPLDVRWLCSLCHGKEHHIPE
jgi:hypothetical protein